MEVTSDKSRQKSAEYMCINNKMDTLLLGIYFKNWI